MLAPLSLRRLLDLDPTERLQALMPLVRRGWRYPTSWADPPR